MWLEGIASRHIWEPVSGFSVRATPDRQDGLGGQAGCHDAAEFSIGTVRGPWVALMCERPSPPLTSIPGFLLCLLPGTMSPH